MRKTKLRTFSCLLMMVLCMTVFSVTAFAAEGGYYASDESGKNTPPDAIDNITISTEDVELKENGSNATTEIDGEEVDLDSFFNNLFDIFGGTDALTHVGNLTSCRTKTPKAWRAWKTSRKASSLLPSRVKTAITSISLSTAAAIRKTCIF